MIVSRCCKEGLDVECDYFICEKCGKPCDTIFVINLETDSHDDKRSFFEN